MPPENSQFAPAAGANDTERAPARGRHDIQLGVEPLAQLSHWWQSNMLRDVAGERGVARVRASEGSTIARLHRAGCRARRTIFADLFRPRRCRRHSPTGTRRS